MRGVAARLPRLAVAVLLAVALPPGVHAQAVADLQDQVVQDQQINRQVQGVTQARGAPGDADQAIDGEAGVYVLLLNDIFQVSASSGLGYTDNPSRTADDRDGSFFADFAVGAGVSTRIAERVDLGLSANLSGREFLSKSGPSSRSASTVLSLGAPLVGPLYANAVGFGGYSFDGGFGQSTSFYGTSGSLSAALPLTGRLNIRPGVGATRQWSGISENRSVSVSGSVDVFYTITPTLSAVARGSLTRRWYDDFYEDVTFVERRDLLAGGSASLAWRPLPSSVVGATVAYESQDSRFFLARFDAFETSLLLSAQVRF